MRELNLFIIVEFIVNVFNGFNVVITFDEKACECCDGTDAHENESSFKFNGDNGSPYVVYAVYFNGSINDYGVTHDCSATCSKCG